MANERKYPRALGDLILVEPLEPETTVGGMVRPGADAERPKEGIVWLAGPGRLSEFGQFIPTEVERGDLLAFPDYAGKPIVNPRGFPPGEYLILRQSEVQLNYGPASNYGKQVPPPLQETHE